ncbi:hypothetical protein M3M33_14765, partial [Loigolactobacillus coryniformis]|uniref:hypothetical protein n=1 Tax=Loigolactobacillus coryniformis TaxID=1610 RepID=UPI00201AC255
STEVSLEKNKPALGSFLNWMDFYHPEVSRPEVAEIWAQGNTGDVHPFVKQFEAERINASVHSIDITPEMRESVMQGLPLFQVERGFI